MKPSLATLAFIMGATFGVVAQEKDKQHEKPKRSVMVLFQESIPELGDIIWPEPEMLGDSAISYVVTGRKDDIDVMLSVRGVDVDHDTLISEDEMTHLSVLSKMNDARGATITEKTTIRKQWDGAWNLHKTYNVMERMPINAGYNIIRMKRIEPVDRFSPPQDGLSGAVRLFRDFMPRLPAIPPPRRAARTIEL